MRTLITQCRVERISERFSSADLRSLIRTLALLSLSFGLRISECLAFKWSDVGWLAELSVTKGIVMQHLSDVKTEESHGPGVAGKCL